MSPVTQIMSKRTRRQKERAAKRRQVEPDPGGLVNREFTFSFQSKKLNKFAEADFKKDDKSFYSESTSLVLKDLTKTVVLAVGILGIEIMIYWAWF